jgi:hypothetical protein
VTVTCADGIRYGGHYRLAANGRAIIASRSSTDRERNSPASRPVDVHDDSAFEASHERGAAESLIAARRRDTTRRQRPRPASCGRPGNQRVSRRQGSRRRPVVPLPAPRSSGSDPRAVRRSSRQPASTAASKQSLLADLANLREQNQRLRRQNTELTARLSEVLGEEVFRASGIGRTDDSEALRTRVGQLEQQVLDLRQELEERTDDLTAARAANRDLMTLANRMPVGPS